MGSVKRSNILCHLTTTLGTAEELDIEIIKNLINKETSLKFRTIPILLSKLVVKNLLEMGMSNIKILGSIKNFVDPARIQVTVRPEELMLLSRDIEPSQSSLMMLVGQNILTDAIGVNIDDLIRLLSEDFNNASNDQEKTDIDDSGDGEQSESERNETAATTEGTDKKISEDEDEPVIVDVEVHHRDGSLSPPRPPSSCVETTNSRKRSYDEYSRASSSMSNKRSRAASSVYNDGIENDKESVFEDDYGGSETSSIKTKGDEVVDLVEPAFKTNTNFDIFDEGVADAFVEDSDEDDEECTRTIP
ncbi:hypothetical protein QAD02_001450 [Eretmocerus hayati]|uniref:Uncharacterized protein n=1 Tax=Eretmocerus hayati TaxID=131215 RepID=A0ACC2NGH5_9HYME|nr:hypothetical protein QAD02_001450 [Eretmocerus hayati]